MLTNVKTPTVLLTSPLAPPTSNKRSSVEYLSTLAEKLWGPVPEAAPTALIIKMLDIKNLADFAECFSEVNVVGDPNNTTKKITSLLVRWDVFEFECKHVVGSGLFVFVHKDIPSQMVMAVWSCYGWEIVIQDARQLTKRHALEIVMSAVMHGTFEDHLAYSVGELVECHGIGTAGAEQLHDLLDQLAGYNPSLRVRRCKEIMRSYEYDNGRLTLATYLELTGKEVPAKQLQDAEYYVLITPKVPQHDLSGMPRLGQFVRQLTLEGCTFQHEVNGERFTLLNA